MSTAALLDLLESARMAADWDTFGEIVRELDSRDAQDWIWE